MTVSFKEFLLESNDQYESLFDYQCNHHKKKCAAIQRKIYSKWKKIVDKYDDIDLGEDIASANISSSPVKMTRRGLTHTVFPSINIDSKYDFSRKEKCRQELISSAYKVLEKYCEELNEHFKGSPFRIYQENDMSGDIRVVFKSGKIIKPIVEVCYNPGTKKEKILFKDMMS